MKIDVFGLKKTNSEQNPAKKRFKYRDPAIALLSTAALAAGMAAYKTSDFNAMMSALSIEQEMSLYSSQENDSALNLTVTSIFDRQFAFGPEGLKEGNVSFMRDSVINRHELACGRDQSYMKEFVAAGRAYLGCSIEPRGRADGVFVNTYSIGEQFGASFASYTFGEHTEYRTDVVFPRNFKQQAIDASSPEHSLDLARLAVELKISARGRVLDLNDSNDRSIIKAALKKGSYAERWVANGAKIESLWQGLEKMGNMKAPSHGDYGLVTKALIEYDMDPEVLKFVSSAQLDAMTGLVKEMDEDLAIISIRKNLDHNCSFVPQRNISKGFGDHNNECAQELGMHRSIQLKYELDSAKSIDIAGTVHGTVKNRIILGSFKGHPVLSNVGNLEADTLAYVPVPKAEQDWKELFLSKIYKDDSFTNTEEDGSSPGLAAKHLHFDHGYAPHHTPIVVGPELSKVFNLSSLDEESRDLIIEMTLEHEIKHIKDYALFNAKGEGTLKEDYEVQQAACDIYAVEVMAKKYDDPRKLMKLRDALVLRGQGFHHSTGEQAIRSMEGSHAIVKAALYITKKTTELNIDHRQNTVLKVLDQRIDDLKSRSTPPGNWSERQEGRKPARSSGPSL